MEHEALAAQGEKTLIKRSPVGLQIQVLGSALVAGLVGVLATWLFLTILDWTPNRGFTLTIITWLVLLLGWAVGAAKLWFDWRIKRYEIAQDALIVHAKAGKWGSGQTIYRYESIISVRMTQGLLGKQFGYGDVEIVIPRINEPIILNDIEDPLNQMAEIQKRLTDRNPASTQALTS